MISMTRNKRPIYLCKKKKDSLTFEEPVKIYVNCQPTYTSVDVVSMGDTYMMYYTIKCSKKVAEEFSYNDRIYLKEPETFNSSCNDADFYVYGEPIITLNEGDVPLRKLNGDQE